MPNWKELFAFTRQERNGILVLSVLLVLTCSYWLLQPLIAGSSARQDFQIPDVYLNNNGGDVTAVSDSSSEHQPEQPGPAEMAGSHSIYQQNNLFLFDPNGLPEEDWVKLGLTPAQARSITKFQEKGGRFRAKEDVAKLYVISPEKYRELEPYIVIPVTKDSTRAQLTVRPQLIIELNTADTSQLVKLAGIGPVFAARIVAYRERLGGYHDVEQLREIFGMDDQKFSGIAQNVKADSSYIRKMNINTAEASELRQHPYFTPSVANALVSYRKAHGSFQTVQDIRKCRLITDDLFIRIAPYLTI